MDRYVFYASKYLDKDFEVPIKEQFRGCYQKLSNHEYEHVGYYSDTRTVASPNRRSGVMNLLRDARQNKFDILLTSDIERLALNRQNLLEIVRRLSAAGVEVYTYIGDGQPLSQQFAHEIYMAEEEAIFRASQEWEQYWDAQMELAESDYPKDSDQQNIFEQAAGSMKAQKQYSNYSFEQASDFMDGAYDADEAMIDKFERHCEERNAAKQAAANSQQSPHQDLSL